MSAPSDSGPFSWQPTKGQWQLLLLSLLALGLFLRFPHPSPTWWHIDERAFVLHPLGFWSGDFNPHFFNYPTLPFYLASALYYLYFLYSYDGPMMHFVVERFFTDGHDLIVLARGLHSVQSALTGVLCAMIGRRLYGSFAGAVVGAFFAVMPLSVRFAHMAAVDTPQVFFQTLALYFAVRLVQSGTRRDALWGGICVGLAAACKYPGALSLVPLGVACWFAAGPLRVRAILLVWSAMAALAAFICTAPYVLLDWSVAWGALSGMSSEHLLSSGHGGEGFSLWHHLRYSLRYGVGWVGLIALIGGLLWAMRRRRREEWVVASAVLAYALFIAAASSVFMRYALPLAPLVALFCGGLLCALSRYRWLVLSLMVALVAEPLYGSWRTRSLLSAADTRELAKEWLAANVPPGISLVQSTVGAGLLRTLSPREVYVRQNAFIESYGTEALYSAYEWLSTRTDLLPLYTHLNVEAGIPTIATDMGEGGSLGVIVESEHPLCKHAGDDELRALYPLVEWQVEFLQPGAEHAVYDWVDWHFVPIGSFGQGVRSGPRIRIGMVPMRSACPPIRTHELFKTLHSLLMGHHELEMGHYAEALEYYEVIWNVPYSLDSILNNSNMYGFLFNMGRAYQAQEALDRAIYFFEKAIELKPEGVETYNDLGIAYARQGEGQKAFKKWVEAIALDPDYADAHFNMGNALYGTGLYREALQSWQRAAQLDSSYESLRYNMGNAHVRLGQWEEALSAYGQAHQRAPQRADILFNMAQAYIGQGRIDPAIETLKKAAELDPADRDIYYHLGDLYRTKGQAVQAQAHFARFLELAADDGRSEGVRRYLSSLNN